MIPSSSGCDKLYRNMVIQIPEYVLYVDWRIESKWGLWEKKKTDVLF